MLGHAKVVAFGATTDSARAAKFYAGTLGLGIRSEDDFALVLDANGVELRLQKVPTLTPPGFTTLGWEVGDVQAVVGALAALGVLTERYPWLTQDAAGVWQAPSGARVAWFKDPDGYLLPAARMVAAVPLRTGPPVMSRNNGSIRCSSGEKAVHCVITSGRSRLR
jgi:catechol 2,3-dioxygenase-like lactoylglutathione lyase family enzyme